MGDDYQLAHSHRKHSYHLKNGKIGGQKAALTEELVT